MTDKAAVEALFAANPDIDCVIQFAAYKAVGESVAKPIEYYSNNLACTLNILDVMRRYGCHNFVFSSSATVYGDPASVPITEDFPTGATTNPYGTTKVFTERILTDCCHADPELNVALLRYFNPIGAHPLRPDRRGPQRHFPQQPGALHRPRWPWASWTRCMFLAMTTPPRTAPACGTTSMWWTWPAAMWRPSKSWRKSPACSSANLGTGHGYSVLDVIHAFSKACGRELPYVIDPRRPGDIAECWADPSKAERELGWKAEYGIDEMCRDSWNWQSKNPGRIQDRPLKTA